MLMEIKFWGVRGSIPTPLSNAALKDKIFQILKQAKDSAKTNPQEILQDMPWRLTNTVGGETTCVEVSENDTIVIFDAGSGIRNLGNELIHKYNNMPIKANIFISHTHWDHINGLPFFVPAYQEQNEINIYGVHTELNNRLKKQQHPDFFPVDFDRLKGIKQVTEIKPEIPMNIGGFSIIAKELVHPGHSYAYSISNGKKKFVFATDGEYTKLSIDQLKPYIDFCKNADIIYFDAQYTFDETLEKENWGHSNAFIGIDLARIAGAKALILGHHDPSNSDEEIWNIYQGAKEYIKIHQCEDIIDVYLGHEGLEIIL